jgi:DNA polymerase-3 subunit gamma/tau
MSQYIVSARKYRPNTFDSVVGQKHVTDTLMHSLLSNQVAHAYLFCGPRGVGKTTIARILARAINCENLSEKGESCNQCASCKTFDVNSSYNIFELDGASNNSVENIRALVEQVRVPPSQGKYKVYIIDEVHMLSSAAFNAFLKTLEEPPPYVKFILATTEKHKILPTILSRCQSFDFRRIPVPAIVDHLKTICAAENIQAEDEALVIISQKGDGSLRDCLSIFDRIASQSKGKITYDGVLESLQLLDYDYFFKMTDALMREDMTEVFLTLSDIQKRGFDGEAFISGYSEHLRDVLLCKDTATAAILTHGDKIKTRYLDQARAIQKSTLITYLDLANQCEVNYSRALNKWLHIEMALVRMCYMHRRVESESLSASPVEKKKPTLNKQEERKKDTPIAGDTTQDFPSEPAVKSSSRNTMTTLDAPVRVTNGSTETISSPPKTIEIIPGDPSIPSLKGLGMLKKKAADLHAEEKKKVPKLTLPPLHDFWNGYLEKHSSPSFKQTMKEAVLELGDEKTIRIRTGHQTGKNRFTAESGLLDGLRDLVRVPDLQIIIEIDPVLDNSRELEKPKKLLSDREKFELLTKKNPLMATLREKLDLIPDQED